MSISPFEERYRTEMNLIFDDQTKLNKWMAVEVALAKAHAKLGHIPKDAPSKIEDAMKKVKHERVVEIESQIHHDLMAMVKALTEQAGDSGKYVHLGATSYDIEDTATALVFLDAIELLETHLAGFGKVLKELAIKHRETVCVGRTHGQHAVPTTYGMKFALYYQELKRNLERLHEAKPRIAVGKMSGAVGTMATFGDDGPKIQNLVMKELGLQGAQVTNQVIQRDRHAEIMATLAITASLLEKIAKEIRNLQRTEILEVSEAFSTKQVGSSTMPQKRNPHKSERVCSLARLVRANVITAIENNALEHERDLTNSANERAIFSESFIAVDYMTLEMTRIVSGLVFYPDNIKKNLELTKGLILAERLMIYLVEHKGIGRQDAHEQVRTLAQEAFTNGRHLKELVLEKKLLELKEVIEIFDYSTYIGHAKKIVEDAVK
ncbi:Argininosuccinate lyase [Candidatus Bilamarchaeum dharawalense]|uniref:Adenylosuccinate lyase n=1 Tax=Candidatus Bilamarchaeum dharawalense TaxID=2885759 RepID=A0A5E4LXL9_9ARCH|nr:Argininosuccinate lyase [Candidatus Bilamarchaeum dharawalense]